MNMPSPTTFLPDWITSRCTRDAATGCLNWKGAVQAGHPIGRPPGLRPSNVARAAYEALNGQFAKGVTVKAACRNERCCEPAHLVKLTRRETLLNGATIAAVNAGKTHCQRGHAYEGANLYIDTQGRRRCRACRSIDTRTFRARRAETVTA